MFGSRFKTFGPSSNVGRIGAKAFIVKRDANLASGNSTLVFFLSVA